MKREILQDNIRPFENDIVRVKDMGNVIELMYSQHKNTSCPILKISGEQYVDMRTGEVKNITHNKSRADDKNSVRASLNTLRDLINTNVHTPSHCLWVTLTYAENMTDTKRLYTDCDKFIKRMKYRYRFQYIVAMEPQNRGAWHAHMIMIFDGKAPFIPNNELAQIWGHGFVTIKKLEDIDNIGAYLTAYLGDMELEEAQSAGMNISNKEIKFLELDEAGKKVKKAFIKGARLHMYPPKFNLFRHSRGIKKPDISYSTEKEARKKVGYGEPTFERTAKISDESSGFSNILNYRQFNILREKNQTLISGEKL